MARPKIKSDDEKPQPGGSPAWPPKPLPNESELPEGVGHGKGPSIKWPTPGGPDDAAKPYTLKS